MYIRILKEDRDNKNMYKTMPKGANNNKIMYKSIDK